MANAALKFQLYSKLAEGAAITPENPVQSEEVKKEEPVVAKKEETNEKPQIENTKSVFNLYNVNSGGLRI